MRRAGRTGPRLVAIFLAAGVGLNYPILSIFSKPVEVAGLPLLGTYVFGAWLLTILAMALVVERTRD
jgi:hypothetical protein